MEERLGKISDFNIITGTGIIIEEGPCGETYNFSVAFLKENYHGSVWLKKEEKFIPNIGCFVRFMINEKKEVTRFRSLFFKN